MGHKGIGGGMDECLEGGGEESCVGRRMGRGEEERVEKEWCVCVCTRRIMITGESSSCRRSAQAVLLIDDQGIPN